VIFDLDETLIHSLRNETEEDEMYPYWFSEDKRLDMSQLNQVELMDPTTNEREIGGFFTRPFLTECLQAVNTKYEVAIFTIATDWYADPIIDKLDPDGTLIQHRFYR
jgi:TFIIF-interacting CTD phosphatase-like protein